MNNKEKHMFKLVQEPIITFPSFEKRKLYDALGNELPSHAGITNTETGETVSVMSSRYEIMNHEEAHDIMDRAATNLCPEAKAKYDFGTDGKTMKLTWDLPQQYNIEVGEGDSLRTRLVGLNSVDGSKSLSFHIDFERLVCANGMVGFTREFSFNRKHSRHIKTDIGAFDLEKQVEYAWCTVKERAGELRNNAVDYAQGMAVIKEVVDRKLFPKKLEKWISEEWRRASHGFYDQAQENGSNLWTLYNSFTSAITHEIDKQGNNLTDGQKELYGRRVNNLFGQLLAA
jgi:hypothetical protein